MLMHVFLFLFGRVKWQKTWGQPVEDETTAKPTKKRACDGHRDGEFKLEIISVVVSDMICRLVLVFKFSTASKHAKSVGVQETFM